MTHHDSFSERNGFVLGEVMMAIGIFGIVVVAWVAALNQGMDGSRESSRWTRLRRNLESRVAELKVRAIAAGHEALPPDGEGVSYETDIQPLSLRNRAGEEVRGVYRIALKAKWNEGGETREHEVKLDVYRP